MHQESHAAFSWLIPLYYVFKWKCESHLSWSSHLDFLLKYFEIKWEEIIVKRKLHNMLIPVDAYDAKHCSQLLIDQFGLKKKKKKKKKKFDSHLGY